MTREQAQTECDRHGREHADREAAVWLPRASADGDWTVAKVLVPAGMNRSRFKAMIEAKPRPQQADDPRQAIVRNIPPYGAGI